MLERSVVLFYRRLQELVYAAFVTVNILLANVVAKMVD